MKTLHEIQQVKSRAEKRTIDMGPFGGIETFVSHDDIIMDRRTVIELCDLAAEALKGRQTR